MEQIISKSNPLVKSVKKLMSSSKERAQQGLFVLEGARLCFDVLSCDCRLNAVLMTEAVCEKYPAQTAALRERAARACLISEEVSARLSETESAQGIFCVCAKRPDGAVTGNAVIALDKVQDPSNLGAVIRSAEAFGIDSVIVYGCCDLYNPKALRASMGGALRVNIVQTQNLMQTLQALADTYRIYATVPDRQAMPVQQADFSVPCVCIIGNEANGIEPEIIELADARVTIPMRGRAESLNAAAAAAVTMWEMRR